MAVDLGNMSPDAVAVWNALTSAYGGDLNITSAYRSPEHNAAVGGAKHSQHMQGNAYDIDVSGMSEEERRNLIELARSKGFNGVGIYDNSLHFDIGGARTWGSDYTKNSVPEWAMGGQNALAGYRQPQQNALAEKPEIEIRNFIKPMENTFSMQSAPVQTRNYLEFL